MLYEQGSLTTYTGFDYRFLFTFFLLVIIWHIILFPLLVTFLYVNILLVPFESAVINSLLLLISLLVHLEDDN